MKIKIVLMTWELVHVEGYVPVEQRERERGGGGRNGEGEREGEGETDRGKGGLEREFNA